MSPTIGFAPLKTLLKTPLVFASALAALLSVGCIEQSTVVKVKRDRSGLVHIRLHQQEISFFAAADTTDSSATKVPSPETLQAVAAQLGRDVKLVSAKQSNNRNGWNGYDLIFSFPDINDVRLPGDLMKSLEVEGDSGDDAIGETSDDHETPLAENESSDNGKKDSPDGFEHLQTDIQFAMTDDGRLEIRTTGFADKDTPDEPTIEGAVDPFAGEPASPVAKISIPDAAIEKIASKVLA
ncbi:MAG: hypothetical protein HKN47_17315, partial [Pirellulaceae bacterium]|nr:hypothetical protein [Pirellulaceae bacterium]